MDLTLEQLASRIDDALLADRFRLRKWLRGIQQGKRDGRNDVRQIERLANELEKSIAVRQARQTGRPKLTWDDELPISAKRDEIADVLNEHQVVVICGETGSGKSTQLPKICLDIGRGIDGLIGHTQPRRIAARSVAERIAEELGSPLGEQVGYKVRFTDATRPETYIKLMTDGILLAETQRDRFLEQYDTLIIDEAHERSLNVDFLLGFLTRLLPRRPDLKLIVTSATIDAERFSHHFSTHRSAVAGQRSLTPAPIIEVSGRMYPVEVRYRSLQADDEMSEPDLQQAIVAALEELTQIDRGGDVLVFLPTEREIHETVKVLKGTPSVRDSRTELLPLYARLSAKEQHRVFEPHTHRRIVLATNVAESSLTVPGIRFVIDTGTARISRYSPRSRMQRLPIEAVSRASADQRKGRCGRVGPGVAIRLFSEDDYNSRDRFTTPEIRRTNLASVILQTKALNLGAIEAFPFIDPPRPELIRDGYQTLFELGAIDEHQELTDIGRNLARLPVDPRIGRMILAGIGERCLREVLIIASALELQDPRERPADKRQVADEAHAKFTDPTSDFLSFLKMWDFYQRLKANVTKSQLRKACQQNFLSHNRLREWSDIHRQLRELVEEHLSRSKIAEANDAPSAQRSFDKLSNRGGGGEVRPADRLHDKHYAALHRALLTGLLSGIAQRTDDFEYTGAGGVKFFLWPGSGVFEVKPKWIVAGELVETTRRYGRTIALIDSRWIEPLAEHVLKRTYSDPHWVGEAGSVMATEKISLFGLPIGKRTVRYGAIDPVVSRELFIRHGLADGDVEINAPFFRNNQELRDELTQDAAKFRRGDLLIDHQTCFDFYHARLPADVFDVPSLHRWRQVAERDQPRLLWMSRDDLLETEPPTTDSNSFPDQFHVDHVQLPLQYRFEPGAQDDGITLVVPKDALHQVTAERLGWLVPGLLEQKVDALIRSLPKSLRRELPPTEDAVRSVMGDLRFGEGPFLEAVAMLLSRVARRPIGVADFQLDKLPHFLQMNVRVVDEQGQTVAADRDVKELCRKLGVKQEPVREIHERAWHRDALTKWDFGDLPEQVSVTRGGVTLPAYPTLIDRGDHVVLRLLDSRDEAKLRTRVGVRKLFVLAEQHLLREQVAWFPNLNAVTVLVAPLYRSARFHEQLAELIAERAYLADAALPRTANDFETRRKTGRERCQEAVVEVVRLVTPLTQTHHEIRLAIQEAALKKFQYAIDDIRSQLDHLLVTDFLTTVPWTWLQHFPRYLKAQKLRLEKVSSNATKDREATELLTRLWHIYRERADHHQAAGRHDPELQLYRWMLEEFRVSLFAQTLGTAFPISIQRLEKQWGKVKL